MSSSLSGAGIDGGSYTVDDEAYELPSYDDVFPSLPQSEGPAPPVQPANQWKKKMVLRSSTVTQVFTVPLEERKFKEMSEQQFGEKGGQQAKICQDIMSRTGVHIEMSLSRDQSLSVVLTGKHEKVLLARKLVVQQLQTQASIRIRIPREHHRFLIGRKGKALSELELQTQTKVNIPRAEENTDVVTITGTKEGIERARHEIQCISDEQAKLAFERLTIPKIYHPFICGPNNSFIQDLAERTGARISVPPPIVDKPEVVVSGEKEGVHHCVQQIMKIYKEKEARCTTVSVEVRKTQHKYVIGPRGAGLSEILGATGVSVEVPQLESDSETITLRGDSDKLGPALTMVYSKANSVVIEKVDAPAWLHRFIIGRKGANIRKIMDDYPKVHIEFTEGEDKITIEGPPEEVGQAKEKIMTITTDFLQRMAFAEIEVDQKYHRHIIGKNGVNVNRIKNETGVSIKIPENNTTSHIIRIEGSPEGVAQAKQELLEMVHKFENEKSRDIMIDSRFHKTLIGAAGGKIREIRDRFNQVNITFPDASRKSDVVTLRGPKNDVDRCFKYLQQLTLELHASNYQAQVHIFKQFHKNIIGKGGQNIRKIRDETDTKIDLPSENSDSDVITITGKKEHVEKAKGMIEAIQKDLANIKEVAIEIPHKFHNSIIGAKGRLIRSIMEECGGVIIRFPEAGSTSDKVVIRGPTDDVENAKKQLLELTHERKESGHTIEVRAKPEYHKFLIGRGGSNIRKVRENLGVRIIFPTHNDPDQELIIIMGKKEEVDKAKAQLEILISDLDKIIEAEINVDPKFHRHFVARRGEVLRNIADDYGGVAVSFPRSGVKSDKVVLKGAKDCVDGAKKRILEIVHDLEQQVTIECVISQKHHRTIMGARGAKVQEVTKSFDVGIKFPDKPNPDAEKNGEPLVNGDQDQQPQQQQQEEGGEGDAAPKRCDIIIITGKKENCEMAKDALLALIPITEEMEIPFCHHRFIIGQKGEAVRKMMSEYDVNISIPPAMEQSDCVKISGAPTNVTRAKEALAVRVQELEDERLDKELKSHVLEVEVDPKYHPKIIGRKGTVITKIRKDHDVEIQFPNKGAENQSIILITGYEDKAEAAKKDILSIVEELEDMLTEQVEIDARVHSRIIGQKGRAVRKIMDDYKVDIRFPTSNSPNKNIIEITGAEDNVLDCKEHLLNLEEEFMQDVIDRELMKQYESASARLYNEPEKKVEQKPFMVRDAPWSKTPDMNSDSDFPELGTNQPAAKSGAAWGPWKR